MKNRKLTVLVTGSEGFIGKRLCNALSYHQDVRTIITMDRKETLARPRNIVTYYDVKECMAEKPDIVFHLAAETKVEHDNKSAYMIDTNIVGTHLLLDNLPNKNCRFVFVSSVHAAQPVSVYGASKVAGEALVQAYNAMGLCNGVILRLTSCVGKGMTHSVVKDIMSKLQYGRNNKLELIGTYPGSRRPFVHIYDVIRALIFFGLENEIKEESHNISCSNSVWTTEVAQTIMDTLKIYKSITWTKESWLGDLKDIRIKPTSYMHFKYNNSLEAIAQAVKDNLQNDI
jgi:UDP-glucose 4-epimerase